MVIDELRNDILKFAHEKRLNPEHEPKEHGYDFTSISLASQFEQIGRGVALRKLEDLGARSLIELHDFFGGDRGPSPLYYCRITPLGINEIG